MFGSRDTRKSGSKSKGKDLQRLSRQDLLELLVGQMREGDELRAVIETKEHEAEDLVALSDRLKEKLDLKDEQIEHLKEKLNLKDEQIENLKGKLNDKDAQIERLKVKLDDKDELIERLKRRLDAKDALIVRLGESQNVALDDLEILEARERVATLVETSAEVQNEESLVKNEESFDE